MSPARGVYLLSFLPETDVDRIVDYAIANGKRSFAALVPENAYGSVVEAAFQQAVARSGGRVVVLERYPLDRQRMADPARRVAQAAQQVDAIFIPDGGTRCRAWCSRSRRGVNAPVQLLGTGLWDDPRIFAEPALHGGWFAAPDARAFVVRRAIAPVTARTRCAPRRSPMTRCRWSPRW